MRVFSVALYVSKAAFAAAVVSRFPTLSVTVFMFATIEC